MAKRRWQRYSLESLSLGEEDRHGHLFIGPEQVNQDKVHLLHTGVDTLRVLVSGKANEAFWRLIESRYEQGPGQIIELGRTQFALRPGGSRVGYRWRLQNNEVGIIIWYGSYHSLGEQEGNHLKVEFSPHFLEGRSASEVQGWIDFAVQLGLTRASDKEYKWAVHLACDVQGWEPPETFEDRLITRAKRRSAWDGVDSIEFDSSGACVRYGAGESYLWGSAGGLQLSVYRKDLEARKRDKLDYWEQVVWRHALGEDWRPLYREDRPVWRIEYRLHHSVVRQLLDGVGVGAVDTYAELLEHLNGFWRYSTETMRLDYSRGWVDPFWQLIQEDARFSAHDHGWEYRRDYKTPARGSEKNIGLALGNLLSLYVRQRYTVKQALKYLRESGIWGELSTYFERRDLSISEFVEKGMAQRRLLGKAA